MSCYFMFFKGKYRHTRRKMVGLIRQLFRCHRRFFYQRGVLLCHLIHLADSLRNLLNPRRCSSDAEAISPIMSFTRVTELTISVMVAAALFTSFEPCWTRLTDSSISL